MCDERQDYEAELEKLINGDSNKGVYSENAIIKNAIINKRHHKIILLKTPLLKTTLFKTTLLKTMLLKSHHKNAI